MISIQTSTMHAHVVGLGTKKKINKTHYYVYVTYIANQKYTNYLLQMCIYARHVYKTNKNEKICFLKLEQYREDWPGPMPRA